MSHLVKPYETNCGLWIWAIQIKFDWLIDVGHQSGGGLNANLDENTSLPLTACSSEPCRPRWSSSPGAAARVRRRWSNCRTWRYDRVVTPQALPAFWASAARLSGVHLHLPTVAGFCSTGHPLSYSFPSRLQELLRLHALLLLYKQAPLCFKVRAIQFF